MNKLIIGETEYELESVGRTIGTCSTPHLTINGEFYVGKAIPNQPKQKDWEILSFYFNEDDVIFKLEDNGLYVHPHNEKLCYPLNEMLHKPPCVNDGRITIHSIKRLSDNNTFTIDDKFTVDAGQELTIRKFELIGYIIKVYSKECGCWNLSNIKKVDIKKIKKILFTTFDGQPILEEGVKTWIVKEDQDYHIMDYFFTEKYINSNKWKLFSTEESAKEYVAKNLRCFSFNDIVNVMTQSGNDHFPFFPQLYDLAKERVDGK